MQLFFLPAKFIFNSFFFEKVLVFAGNLLHKYFSCFG